MSKITWPDKVTGDQFSAAEATATKAAVNAAYDLLQRAANAQTDNYTLVLADQANRISMTKATALSLTVPPNSSVAFPIGTSIPVSRGGVGILTFVAGAGVTITSSAGGTLVDGGLNFSNNLVKTGTDTWMLQNGSPNDYLDYSATWTGFSSLPTGGFYRYCLIGKLCHVMIWPAGFGTSNDTAMTITLPFAAKNTFSFPNIEIADAGTIQSGYCYTGAGSNILTFTKWPAGSFTASGNKLARVILTYEIQ